MENCIQIKLINLMAFRKSDKLRPNGWQNIGIFGWKLSAIMNDGAQLPWIFEKHVNKMRYSCFILNWNNVKNGTSFYGVNACEQQQSDCGSCCRCQCLQFKNSSVFSSPSKPNFDQKFSIIASSTNKIWQKKSFTCSNDTHNCNWNLFDVQQLE